MAKISSPWVGAASGKLGEGVYYRSGGQQLARAKASSVKNPKAIGQMMSRISLATAARAYSALKPLADHAFQNYAYGAKNQQRFMKLNASALRSKVSEVGPILRNSRYNYNVKDDFNAVINDYTISEGNLPVVPVVNDGADGWTAYVDIQAATYQDVCDKLGLPAGAQLTFVVMESDATEEAGGKCTGVHYARVILSPADGDMSKQFIVNSAVNDPNEKNQGAITFPVGADGMGFTVDSVEAKKQAAVAVIASAYEDGKWRRSTQRLVVRPNVETGDNKAFYDSEQFIAAYESYMPAASTSESDKYLNEGE